MSVVDSKRASRVLYTVYDNRTDELVCFEMPAAKAAEFMGVSNTSFRSLVTRSQKDEKYRWGIYKRKVDFHV